ncbi:hypothetical protein [Paractinoplanes lichenicola]|uniref:Uncharacterized protein n=1 Tax=Paractinoplanes lichenicola TaxID=2802976 RepID=A0ABS1VF03_9ACTN|nr:hypothetical protein [Actinoplanes lichenicola]MBL7252734.1 hypothetical protein [Actinoplanes lichenicola]
MPPAAKTFRHPYAGARAAAAALLAMSGVALAGLLLLDAGRVGRLDRLAAAVVGLAAGAPLQVGAVPSGGLPVAVSGRLDVMPLGVTLAGMVVLGVLLARGGRAGLLLRGGTAVAVFAGGAGMVAWFARGALTLPAGAGADVAELRACPSDATGLPGLSAGGGAGLPGLFGRGAAAPGLPGRGALDAGFTVSVGPAVGGAAMLALAVAALCWVILRFPAARAGVRALRWPALGIMAVGLSAAAVVVGPPAAGGLLLALPLGLALPSSLHADGMLACALEGRTTPIPVHLAGVIVLLAVCVIVAVAARHVSPGRPFRRAAGVALAAGLALAAIAFGASVSAALGVRALIFALPLLDVRLTVNPGIALLVGLVVGSVASLLVDAFHRLTA